MRVGPRTAGHPPRPPDTAPPTPAPTPKAPARRSRRARPGCRGIYAPQEYRSRSSAVVSEWGAGLTRTDQGPDRHPVRRSGSRGSGIPEQRTSGNPRPAATPILMPGSGTLSHDGRVSEHSGPPPSCDDDPEGLARLSLRRRGVPNPNRGCGLVAPNHQWPSTTYACGVSLTAEIHIPVPACRLIPES